MFASLTFPIFPQTLVRNSELRCPLSSLLRGSSEPHGEAHWEVLTGVRPQSFLFRLELRPLREQFPPEIKRAQSRAHRAPHKSQLRSYRGYSRCA